MPTLEHFVVLMYDRTTMCTQVNDARKALFTKKGRSMDAIPPTAAALVHTPREWHIRLDMYGTVDYASTCNTKPS